MERGLDERVAGEYNTFRVYLYVLRKKKVGIRDLQNALGFSSPNLATYHLRKLESIGLLRREDSQYLAISKSFGVLRLFLVPDRYIIPKSFFFFLLFLPMTIGFLVFFPQHPFFQAALVVSVIGLILSLCFTIQFYKVLPKT
jgi:hypothetical protein